MSNQIVIAGTMIGMCEALHYARHAGLDIVPMPTGFLSTVNTAGVDAWVPKAKYFHASRTALHEELGFWVYRARALFDSAP